MKILLVALNAKYIHSSLALRSLRASLTPDFCCEILELTINNRSDELLAQIYKSKPDVLGLSCYIWSADMLLETSVSVKKLLPDVKIIAGGPEASYDAERILRNYPVDMVVLGEGDEIFARLAADNFKLKGGLSHKTPHTGIACLQNGRLMFESTPEPDPNRLNFAYFDFDGLENKIIYYESSRGCPFGCAYCMSALTKTVRRLNTETVYRHLDAFLALKPPQIKFTDRTFNADARYATDIWRYLMSNDNGITNFHFEISGGLLDEQALNLLADARPGLFQFEIGVQTTCPESLKAINRPNDLSRLFENIRGLVRGGNIHIHLDLIAGLPYEGFDSFAKSFNRVYSLNPHQLQLGFLKLLKGSPLRERAEEYKILYTERAPYEVYATAWLSYDELLRLKEIESALEDYYNSGQFRCSIRYLSQLFETPFEFYSALAQSRRAGSRGKARLFSELYDFGQALCGEEKLRELLRFDFCLNETPRALPNWLRADNIEMKKRLRLPKRAEIFRYTVDDFLNGGELAEAEVCLEFDYQSPDPVLQGVNARVSNVSLK